LREYRNTVESAIREYNNYHSPEATTKLVSINEGVFQIEFTGSFCHTCGFYDYFDDYKILLDEKGLKVAVAEISEIDDGAAVTFKILDFR
jgi:superoxide reductase